MRSEWDVGMTEGEDCSVWRREGSQERWNGEGGLINEWMERIEDK